MKSVIYTKRPGLNYQPLYDLLESLGAVRSQESCWKVPFDGKSLDLMNWLINMGGIDFDDTIEVIDHSDPSDYVWQNIGRAAEQTMIENDLPWVRLVWSRAS